MRCVRAAVALLLTNAGAERAFADAPVLPEAPGTPVASSGVLPKEGEPVEVQPESREPVAADVEAAPLPGQESGRLDREPRDSGQRQLARVLLAFPKITVYAIEMPVRGTLWAVDHYQLEDRYNRWLYSDDRSMSLVPTISFETGFGGTAGARFEHTDLFGHHERLDLEATFGFGFQQSHLARWRSGELFGSRFQLEIAGNFERRPEDRFYGIGNGDTVSTAPMPIDPRDDDTAVKSFYRYQEGRGAVTADLRVASALHVVGAGSIASFELTPSDTDPSIESVYMPADVTGFDQTVDHGYGELELRWDDRGRSSVWEPIGVYSTGSLATVFAGRVVPLDDGDGDGFWHYGAELQHFIRLAKGPRVLSARLRGDAVSGGYDDVPINELPTLGGSSFLRGYPYQRFRDRVAAFGSVQYRWDISRRLDSYLFVDTGRVFSSLDDLTLSGLRTGFGIGIELHTNSGFLAEASMASSVDGGLVFSLSLNPVLDARPRWR